MTSSARQYGPASRRLSARSASPSLFALPFLAWILTVPVVAQHPVHQATTPARSQDKQTPSAQDGELASRLATAAVARQSGNPAEVANANALLIASALRNMAALRSVEAAYPQAVELYKSSLSFEDVPEARIGLAMVESEAGHYDEAINLALQLHTTNPKDIRVDRILSSSYIQKGEFAKAIDPLGRVAQADPSLDTQYAFANCLLQTKRPEDRQRAQQVFHTIEQQHGDSGSLHVLIGRAYRDAGDLPAAVQEFERAIAIDPRTPHAHYFLGLAKLSLNEWKPTPEAEAEIRREVEYNPKDYLANYMSGFLASGERQYDQAEPFLRSAAALDPSAPEPFLYLGLNAYAKSDNKTAEEMLRKAVELTGTDEARGNYQIRRAYVDLGRILAASGRAQESEVFLTKARELQNKTMEQSQQSIASMAAAGSNAAAVVQLNKPSSADTALNEPVDEAARLDASASKAPTKLSPVQRTELDAREKQLRSVLALAYNDLGTAEAVRGEFVAAASLYRKAEDWDNSLPGLETNLGQSEFRSGNFEGAISPLTQALLQQPDNHGVRAMLGISYFNQNRFTEAVRTFAPLGPAGMQDDEVGYAWAASLARTGDMNKATEVLTAYSSQPRPGDVQLLIGQLWTAIGDYPRAISTFHGALAADPSLRKAHLDTGLAYVRSEHWPEAAKEFQAELALAPDDPDAKYHLGFVYLQQDKIDDAAQLFQQVIATHPDYANAQYELGKIQLDRGQLPSAITHLQAAEQASPQTAYIHYQLQAAYRKSSRDQDADKELAIYKQLKADAREQAAERAMAH